MSQVQCPHCAGVVVSQPGMGGASVACPHCGNPFLLPDDPPRKLVAQPTPPPAPPTAPPPAAQPADQPEPDYDEPEPSERKGPSTGMIVGIVALLIGLPIVVGGGIGVAHWLKVSNVRGRANAAAKEEMVAARRTTLQALGPFGYASLRGEISISKDGPRWTTKGMTAKTKGPALPFECVFNVKMQRETRQWELLTVHIDGEQIYPKT